MLLRYMYVHYFVKSQILTMVNLTVTLLSFNTNQYWHRCKYYFELFSILFSKKNINDKHIIKLLLSIEMCFIFLFIKQ